MTGDVAARAGALLGASLTACEVRVGSTTTTLLATSLSPLATRAGALRALLGGEERARADAMRVAAAAAGFVAGRAVLRAVLGAALGRDPSSLPLVNGVQGKPHLDDDRGAPGFNVAHSGGLVVVALAHEADVGVDLESPRRLPDLERLARRGLTPGERALFDAWCAEGHEREAAFLRAWTVKEARIKALGLSVSAALSRDRVDVAALPWAFAPLDQPGYVCAVAVAPRS